MTDQAGSLPAADQTLDCKGMLCPLPVVKVSKAMKELPAGNVLLLLATDPGSRPDMTAWSKRTGNPIVHQDEEGPVFRFWIQRAG
ncbi:MAG: sulfurtransferase TusA family protein [Gemmatimonadetes bacterium]|nr:sulfurtransferase TusA family protein [Gemmatimonadota bacterium]